MAAFLHSCLLRCDHQFCYSMPLTTCSKISSQAMPSRMPMAIRMSSVVFILALTSKIVLNQSIEDIYVMVPEYLTKTAGTNARNLVWGQVLFIRWLCSSSWMPGLNVWIAIFSVNQSSNKFKPNCKFIASVVALYARRRKRKGKVYMGYHIAIVLSYHITIVLFKTVYSYWSLYMQT